MLRLADFFMRLEARLSYALIGLVQATGYAGGLDFSVMLFRKPDTPKTPLTLLILLVIEVKTDEADKVFRRFGNAAIPVFDASFRDSKQLSEGAAVLRRACASHRLRRWS